MCAMTNASIYQTSYLFFSIQMIFAIEIPSSTNSFGQVTITNWLMVIPSAQVVNPGSVNNIVYWNWTHPCRSVNSPM